MTEYYNGRYWPSAGRRCITCNRTIRVTEKAERRVLDGAVYSMHLNECPPGPALDNDIPFTAVDITEEMRSRAGYCCPDCEVNRQESLRRQRRREAEREEIRRVTEAHVLTEWERGLLAQPPDPRPTVWQALIDEQERISQQEEAAARLEERAEDLRNEDRRRTRGLWEHDPF